jgi:hypothetical protein
MSRLVFSHLMVELLDQTGQGVVDFAREDQNDRLEAVLSDKTVLRPHGVGVVAVGDVQRMEGRRQPSAGLRTGDEFLGAHANPTEHRQRDDACNANAILHLELLKKAGFATESPINHV